MSDLDPTPVRGGGKGMSVVDDWMDALWQKGFLTIDVRQTHYVHAWSAASALRRRAARQGLPITIQVLGRDRALVAVSEEE